MRSHRELLGKEKSFTNANQARQNQNWKLRLQQTVTFFILSELRDESNFVPFVFNLPQGDAAGYFTAKENLAADGFYGIW